MPMSYRIDPDANLLFVLAAGAISQPERLETMMAWIKVFNDRHAAWTWLRPEAAGQPDHA